MNVILQRNSGLAKKSGNAGARAPSALARKVLQRRSLAVKSSNGAEAIEGDGAAHVAGAGIHTGAAAGPGSPASPAAPPPPAAPAPDPAAAAARRSARRIESLKVQLLAALSSLDRGLAANARQAEEVSELCSLLEGLGGPVALGPGGRGAGGGGAEEGGAEEGGAAAGPSLSGMWRLVYSSGFNTGSLGGRRPGPPAALFPATLGQVYQRVDPAAAHLDNIVELLLPAPPPLPALPFPFPFPWPGSPAPPAAGSGAGGWLGGPSSGLSGGGASSEGGGGAGQESPVVRLTLRHDYEVTPPAGVRIVYEETFGELTGAAAFAWLPRLQAPSLPSPLKPPQWLRSASFEVTFLDAALRITRGDRGELRVYLRDEQPYDAAASSAAAAALDYDD